MTGITVEDEQEWQRRHDALVGDPRDISVEDCGRCGVMWDANRETHRCGR